VNEAAPLQVRESGWRYAPAAVVLHWLLALMIVFNLGIGWYMHSIEDEPGADAWYDLHKSTGMLVFALVLVRAAWRLTHRPAELPASVPRWEALASSIIQWLLYAGMLLLPLTGFLGASHTRTGVTFFGQALPRWREPERDTAGFFFGLHETIVWVMVALVAVHALAGLKHALIDRDRVFQRMWF